MKLFVSVCAKDRSFGKAMRRVQPSLEQLFSAFSEHEPVNQIHEAILVGLTDDLPDGEIQEIPNKDGFFQVLCGISLATAPSLANDRDNTRLVVAKLRQVVDACPFSTPDKAAYLSIVDGVEA